MRHGITIGSLFSGIGGLDLGLETGIRGCGPVRTIWQAECAPYAQHILRREWPTARLYDDVRAVLAEEREAPTVLCGGSPCQDLSLIGKRAGLAGVRSGLWSIQRDIAAKLRPPIVVWENVAGAFMVGRDKATKHLRPPALAKVVTDLDTLGYRVWWNATTAYGVGASHLRTRVLLVAWRPEAVGAFPKSGDMRQRGSMAFDAIAEHRWTAAPGMAARAGEPAREVTTSRSAPAIPPYHRERIEGMGNSVVPQCAMALGPIIGAILRGDDPPAVAATTRRDVLSETQRHLRTMSDPVNLLPHCNVRRDTFPADATQARGVALLQTWPTSGYTDDDGNVWATAGRAGGLKTAFGVVPVAPCPASGCPEADSVDPDGLWPTAISRDWRSGKVSAKTHSKNSRPLNEMAAPGGVLNPAWVERHMGFPDGWTEPDQRAPKPLPRDAGAKACALRAPNPRAAGWTAAAFFHRHQGLSRYDGVPVRDAPYGAHAGDTHVARYTARGVIELTLRFHGLVGVKVKDHSFAHELGHHVESQFGLANLIAAGARHGLDLWDTNALPFGQVKMTEAFAEAFAALHLGTAVDRRRYPAWMALVREVEEAVTGEAKR